MTSPSLPETQRPTEAPPLLLGPKVAARFLGISKTRLWQLSKRPDFPQKVALPGHKARYYRRADLEAWVASLGAA